MIIIYCNYYFPKLLLLSIHLQRPKIVLDDRTFSSCEDVYVAVAAFLTPMTNFLILVFNQTCAFCTISVYLINLHECRSMRLNFLGKVVQIQ